MGETTIQARFCIHGIREGDACRECQEATENEAAVLAGAAGALRVDVAYLSAELAEARRELGAAESAADHQRERAKAAERVLEAERGVVIACTRRAEAAEAERDALREALGWFVTFHSGHVLPTELIRAMAAARRALGGGR